MIAVRLFGGLQVLAGSGRRSYDMPYRPGLTVSAVLAEEGLPFEGIGVILVNGRHASLATPLQDGDRLSVFTPAGGG
ncbi:MAG: MoaD/ThiS family protein [Actinobacteria bacterium]|nr:MoaD/ThiS family protein [Actinomycetota bacterium]